MPDLKKVTVEEVTENIKKNITYIQNVVQLYSHGLKVLEPFKGKPITQRIATAYKTAHPDHHVYLSNEHGLWNFHLRLPGQQFNAGIRMFLGYYPTEKTFTEGRWNDLERAMQTDIMNIKNHEHALMYLGTWVEKHNFAVGILAELKKTMEGFGVAGHMPIGHIYFADDHKKGGDAGEAYAR